MNLRPRCPRPRFGVPAVALMVCACAGSEQECARRLRSFETKLDASSHLPASEFGLSAARTPRVTRSRAVADDVGPVLEISGSTARLDGAPLGTVGDASTLRALQEMLAMSHRNWGILHPDDDGDGIEPLYVLADATVPARLVSALVAELPAFCEPRLVVHHAAPSVPDPLPPSAKPELRAQVQTILATSDPDRKSSLLIELGDQGRGTNASVRALYERVARADPSSKLAELRQGIVPALMETRCRSVDLDALEASVLLVLTPVGPPGGWLPLRRSEGERVLGAPLPAEARVADLAALLEAAEPAPRGAPPRP